jgi:hypothetical protein
MLDTGARGRRAWRGMGAATRRVAGTDAVRPAPRRRRYAADREVGSGAGRGAAGAHRTARDPGEYPLGEYLGARGVEDGSGEGGGRRCGEAAGGEEGDGAGVVGGGEGRLFVVVGRLPGEVGMGGWLRAKLGVQGGRPGGEAEQEHAGREEGGESGLESAEGAHVRDRKPGA